MPASSPIRVCLWSGPRNISTATMRSFEARGDCDVWDEPFYGYYLLKTGIDHPAREKTLAQWPTDPIAIANDCAGPAPTGKDIFFQKHMCQHMLEGLDLKWTAFCRHIFLIRDPAEVAASFYATAGFARIEDLGALRQAKLYDEIKALTRQDWPIIEGVDVLANPHGMLLALCDRLEIPFNANMLSWKPGRRPTDGPWAAHWYARVEASTGFESPGKSPHKGPESLNRVIDQSRPVYEYLRAHKISAAST